MDAALDEGKETSLTDIIGQTDLLTPEESSDSDSNSKERDTYDWPDDGGYDGWFED